MLIVDLKVDKQALVCKVGILRVFPHTDVVLEDQVCHYDYGFLDGNGKIIKEGRLTHLWSDGIIALSGKVMTAMAGKTPVVESNADDVTPSASNGHIDSPVNDLNTLFSKE